MLMIQYQFGVTDQTYGFGAWATNSKAGDSVEWGGAENPW
jgi:hypothetical protein